MKFYDFMLLTFYFLLWLIRAHFVKEDNCSTTRGAGNVPVLGFHRFCVFQTFPAAEIVLNLFGGMFTS